MTKFTRSVACLFATAGASLAQTPRPESLLIDRPMMQAVDDLRHASDDNGRFALGIAQTLRAVEKLQAAYHAAGPRRDGLGQYIPMVRLMGDDTPPRRAPSTNVGDVLDKAGEAVRDVIAVPVSADLIDRGLQQFVDDLAVALRTLDGVKGPDVALTLPLLKLQLDVNGIAPGGQKSLGDILKRLNLIDARSRVNNDDLTVRFDAGDVAWLRGYLHLLSAVTELVLAYDKTELVDTCGEMFFRRVAHSPNYPGGMQPMYPFLGRGIDVVDVIAFIHQLRLPVKDAAHVAAARQHLLATIAESRTSWDAILKETDNDHEWIPNPNQQCVLPRMGVTKETVDGWLAFLDDGQAVLEGTKLVPFWRADDGRGVNVKRLTERPPPFDPVMWLHGSAVGPYLQTGPLANGDTVRRLDRLLNGDFFTFAVWVN